jgi:hypothetical protein
MAVRVAVHQPSPDSTQAVWLDSTPDLSCTDSTQAHWVDVEHQPTDLVGNRYLPSTWPAPLAHSVAAAVRVQMFRGGQHREPATATACRLGHTAATTTAKG